MVDRDGGRLLPRRLVQHTVDADRRGRPGDLEALGLSRGGARRGQGEGKEGCKGHPGWVLRHGFDHILSELEREVVVPRSAAE